MTNIKHIKSFYVFGQKGTETLIVTKDGSVQAFGDNNSGCLGVGLLHPVKELFEVKQLSKKKILKLDSGFNHTPGKSNCFVLAVVKYKTQTEIYSWGNNSCGQIGHGTTLNIYQPKIIPYFSDKFIIDISCGESHSLVLSYYGDVYAFGKNSSGQIGNNSLDNQLLPTKIIGINHGKTISIGCGNDISVALTDMGHVYCWGDNSYGQLGFNDSRSKCYAVPTHLDMGDVLISKISCGWYHTLLLSKELDIYEFGNKNAKYLYSASFDRKTNYPIKINFNNSFIDVVTHKSSKISVGLAKNGKCFYWGKNSASPISNVFKFNNITESKYSTIVETFASYSEPQTTYKMVTPFYDEIMLNGKCQREFTEHSVLGSGAYSTVIKAQSKSSPDLFAIKKIPLSYDDIDSAIKEINLLLGFKDDKHFTNIFDFWYEENYYLEKSNSDSLTNVGLSNLVYQKNKDIILHIRMELCSISLKTAIEILYNDLKNSLISPSLYYYIVCQLFLEIIEGVNCLHKMNPPIIHRDLKPDNILLTLNNVNSDGKFIKIADLGLSTIHEFKNQSHTKDVGTVNYRAPEVKDNRKYDTKSDMYSIGIIGDECVVQKFVCDSSDNLLLSKYYTFIKNLRALKSPLAEKRPNCETLIKQKSEWLLTLDEIMSDEILKLNKMREENDLVKSFIKIKLKQQQEATPSIKINKDFKNNIYIPKEPTNKRIKLSEINNDVSNMTTVGTFNQSIEVQEINDTVVNNGSHSSYSVYPKRQRIIDRKQRNKDLLREKELEDEKRRQEKSAIILNEDIDNITLREKLLRLQMDVIIMEDKHDDEIDKLNNEINKLNKTVADLKETVFQNSDQIKLLCETLKRFGLHSESV